jgi:hypothetical protein
MLSLNRTPQPRDLYGTGPREQVSKMEARNCGAVDLRPCVAADRNVRAPERGHCMALWYFGVVLPLDISQAKLHSRLYEVGSLLNEELLAWGRVLYEDVIVKTDPYQL